MGEKVRVFVVLVRQSGASQPLVYKESLTGTGARELAKCLALAGQRSSVIRIDLKATDLVSVRFGGHTKLPVCRKRA